MRARLVTALMGVAGIASSATIPLAESGNTSTPSTTTSSSINSESGTTTISDTNTASFNTTASGNTTATAAGAITKIDNKIMILARDTDGANSASAGLSAYGIPFEPVIIPKAGATIPTLNTSATEGRYSGIIVIDALAYEYDDGWRSAVTEDQWKALWAYQASFKVRMVRINEFPNPSFGAALAGAGGCCDTGVEQLISFTNTSLFPTANLKTNAGITSRGLWHYPAVITDPSTTTQVAKFGPGGSYTSDSVAAVVNKFSDGREQFVWFTSWAPFWSATSNYLQHAHIHWMTRGIFLGKRKTHLGAQVDDVQLKTNMYWPANASYKITTADLDGHVTWMEDLNSRLPAGSNFKVELAHNGNGDILAATAAQNPDCVPNHAVVRAGADPTTLEYKKPLGDGVDQWPTEFTAYNWSLACAKRDSFATWFSTPSKLNAFMHMSHTFSHEELNNATYSDAMKEIQFNQDWMRQIGIAQAASFSAKGLVPPAITGMHNGDVIKAWMDSGLTSATGDNTRPVLRNPQSKYYPLTSTVDGNGHAGLTIIPRYSTAIYYNCDTPECTTKEWIDTSAGKGNFTDLLALAKAEGTRYLFGLQADPYMFHQANMRQTDMPSITVGSKTAQMSLLMAWTETITQELTRLTNWPIISLKHDDIAQYFIDRQTLDNCQPALSYGFAADGTTVTSVTVSTSGNSCSVPVPVTIPDGTTTATGGSVASDKVGSEPPIQWVTLNGQPVTLRLSAGVKI